MPTKKTTRGGKRPGAGRKSDAQKQGIDLLIAQAVTKADWLKVIKKLVMLAMAGDTKAAKILLEYAYGKPRQAVELTTPEDRPVQIQIVEVAQPNQRSRNNE